MCLPQPCLKPARHAPGPINPALHSAELKLMSPLGSGWLWLPSLPCFGQDTGPNIPQIVPWLIAMLTRLRDSQADCGLCKLSGHYLRMGNLSKEGSKKHPGNSCPIQRCVKGITWKLEFKAQRPNTSICLSSETISKMGFVLFLISLCMYHQYWHTSNIFSLVYQCSC